MYSIQSKIYPGIVYNINRHGNKTPPMANNKLLNDGNLDLGLEEAQTCGGLNQLM